MRQTLLTALLFASACGPSWATNTRAAPRAGSPGGTGGAAQAPAQPQGLQALADLEDRRSLGEKNLLLDRALIDPDAAVRARALQALGRIQDPTTAEALAKGLSDPDAAARAEAAFSLGLMGLSWVPLDDALKAKLVEAVRAAEATETDPAVRLTLLEALGRLGGPAAVERLTERLTASPELQARAALSLGIAAKAGTATARAITPLTGLMKKELPLATRYGAAYALAQAAQTQKNVSTRAALLVGTQDEASDVRSLAAKGLGEIGTDADAVTLQKLLDDPDYRVAVEATRGLAKLAARCKSAACPAVGALKDLSFRVERLARGDSAGGGQPLLALAQQGLPVSGRALLVSLRSQLAAASQATVDSKAKKDLANLDCRFAAALDRQLGLVQESLSCGNGLVPEPLRLSLALHEVAQSTAADPAHRAQELGSYVFHTDPRVKLAALEALGSLKGPPATDKVRTLLGNPDLTLAVAAASAAAQLGDATAVPQIRALMPKVVTLPELAPGVAEALATLNAKDAVPELTTWLQSTHAAIRNGAAEALTRLTGAKVVAARVERPDDGVRPPTLPKDPKLTVVTEKGEFEVKLFAAEAPLTSLNMYTLARKSFFRGLTFHRVVPDFVVQGGDPRGDGEGGPGYTVRCEVNRRVYARGVVGMALSGKDTGGSQFFVTAAPQPHLDGRYTAFGEVVKGQEVVDALLEGDAIVDVRASP
jgi:cyclophilin family peptidyl-prolyl cis-trans isomerase/HEAT repeat protein